MFYIGCHLSCSKGFTAMERDAERIGATTFQFFTRNPRGSSVKALDLEDIREFLKRKEEKGLGTLVAHAPYTLNACSADEKVREFARNTMADDLERLEHTPGNVYNFHPGSHVKQGTETGIRLIAETLNAILKPEQSTIVLLETMAGKGSEVGSRFEELREILDRVELSEKMGVCLDRGLIQIKGCPFKRQYEPSGGQKGPPCKDRGGAHRPGCPGAGGEPSGAP